MPTERRLLCSVGIFYTVYTTFVNLSGFQNSNLTKQGFNGAVVPIA